MTRLLLLSVVVLASSATVASAQTMTASITAITGRTASDLNRPINKAECAASSTRVTLLVNNIPAETTTIDVWGGPRASNCGATTARSGASQVCDHLTSFTIQMGQTTFTQPDVPLQTLVPQCTGTPLDQQALNIWFLPTKMAMSTAEPQGNQAPLLQLNNMPLQIDTQPPAPPTGLQVGSGDTQMTARWVLGSSTNLYAHRIFAERVASAADAGACSSTVIMAGGVAPATSPVAEIPSMSATSGTFNPAALNVLHGEQVIAGVTAIDQARNESVLSNVVCATRVPTAGFYTRYQAYSGTVKTCSVSMPRRSGIGDIALLVIVGGVATWFGRRRRSR